MLSHRAISPPTTVRAAITPSNTVTTEVSAPPAPSPTTIVETASSIALAKNACTQYNAGVDAISAVINDNNAGRAQIAAAVRAANLAASEDPQWGTLAAQLQSVASDQKSLSPTMAHDLAAADNLCSPLTGASHLPTGG
jgi:hypothetical protein